MKNPEKIKAQWPFIRRRYSHLPLYFVGVIKRLPFCSTQIRCWPGRELVTGSPHFPATQMNCRSEDQGGAWDSHLHGNASESQSEQRRMCCISMGSDGALFDNGVWGWPHWFDGSARDWGPQMAASRVPSGNWGGGGGAWKESFLRGSYLLSILLFHRKSFFKKKGFYWLGCDPFSISASLKTFTGLFIFKKDK